MALLSIQPITALLSPDVAATKYKSRYPNASATREDVEEAQTAEKAAAAKAARVADRADAADKAKMKSTPKKKSCLLSSPEQFPTPEQNPTPAVETLCTPTRVMVESPKAPATTAAPDSLASRDADRHRGDVYRDASIANRAYALSALTAGYSDAAAPGDRAARPIRLEIAGEIAAYDAE